MQPARSYQILVVDDEPDICDLTKEYLERSIGLQVDTFCSVAEARGALGKKHYDAIVSDYQMLVEDGIQFLKSLRGRGDRIPFILFTGKGREEVVIEALNNGADSYLQKGGKPAPLYSELEHRIHTAVGKRETEVDLELKNRELQKTNEELAAAEEEMAAQLEEIRAGVEMMEEAQEALRESEMRHRSLFESMLSGAAIHEIVCNADGVPIDYRFLDVNVAFERMTGLRRHEVLGKTVRAVLPSIEPLWIERYGAVALTGVPASFESSSQDLGRRYEVSAYRNAPRQFTTIISDVTERMRADEELKTSRKTLADTIDFLPDATLVVDLEGKVVAWNRAMEKMTGVDKADMLGKGDHEFSIPFYGKRRLQLLDLLTLDDVEIEKRYDFVTRNGDTLYAETFCNALNGGRGAHVWAKATSLLDEKGKKIGAIESIRDITERKHAETTLKQSEEKYRNLVLHSGDPIFNFNPDETYRFVNEAFSTPFGKKPEEIIGKTPHALFPHDEAERRLALVRRVFQSGERGEVEVKVVTVTGEERYYLTMADPRMDDAGRVQSVSCIAKDITERKRVENELKQSQLLLSKILETSPNLIYIFDLKENRNTYRNRGVEDFLGYASPQLQKMDSGLFSIIMHPEDRKGVEEQHERLRHSTDGEVETAEFRLRRADQTWRWMRSRDVVFERDPDGTPRSELGIAIDVTVSKQAEEDLVQREKYLRTILQTTVDGFWIINAKGRFIEVNETYCRMSGYSKEELLGLSANELDAIETRTETADRIARIQRNGSEIFETIHRRKDGSTFDVEVSTTYMTTRGVGQFICFCRDITQRKEMEEALRESENRYRTVADHTYDWEYWVAPDGKMIYASPSCERITGYKPEEFLRNPDLIITIVHGDDQSSIKDHFSHLDERIGEMDELEFRIIARTGEERWIAHQCQAIFDRDGKHLGNRGSNRDITERKQVEMKLRSATEQLEEAHHLAQIGTWDWLVETDSVAWSDELFDIVGRDPSLPAPALAEQSRYYTPASWKILSATVTDALATGAPYQLELEMVRTNGGVRKVIAIGAAKRDDSGNIVGLHGIVQDITKRKQVEAALQEANRKLNLLSSVTRHDITNQVLVLQGQLALLEKEHLHPSAEARLRKAEAAARHVSATIHFTKEYEDIGIQAPTWVSPGRQTVDAFAMLHQEGMTVQDDTKGVELLADPMVEKVPYNLIDNSIRHGGHVTHIKIGAEQVGDAMLITFEDNGVGISKEERTHLFERGFGKHTGFGLFLTREILAITGITITETGKEGQGVRFEMLVPPGAWRYPPQIRRTSHPAID